MMKQRQTQKPIYIRLLNKLGSDQNCGTLIDNSPDIHLTDEAIGRFETASRSKFKTSRADQSFLLG